MLHCVIMGVAGCGKTSVGQALAGTLGATYLDGDDLHPAANVAKMASGQPLTDDDRWPWLDLVGDRLGQSSSNILIGCSALRRVYRDRIRDGAGTAVIFLHLKGAQEVIERRMQARKDHFMPVSLLRSQFETLENLEDDETGFEIDIDRSRQAVVDACLAKLRSRS
ncbi:MAG: gluconokinase [Pseudomonadota bacterium]